MTVLTQTVANIVNAPAGAQTQDVIAAVAITQGQPVYLDSNRQAQLAANTSAIAANCAGVALGSALAGQPLRIQKSGIVSYGTATEGVIYVIGAAGTIEPIADSGAADYVTILGVGTSSSHVDMGNGPIVSGAQVQA